MMILNEKKYYYNLILLSLLLFPIFLQGATQITPKKSTKQMSAITSLAVKFIASQHYEQKNIDEKMASLVFDEYLKTLDPGKIFFTQDDIAKFEPVRKNLGRLLLTGNVNFAFDAFNLLMERNNEYSAYAESVIDKGFDFTKDEKYDFDRTQVPWANSKDELRELWRKKIKNEILTLTLLDKAADEEKKQQKEDLQTATVKSVWTRKPPEERIKKRIEQISHFYNEMEPIEVLEMFISSLAHVYDPHSAYMSPRSGSDFEIAMSLSLVGIGAVLTSEDGYTKIVEIIPGGPAERDGRLKAEDRIVAVAQENEDPVDVIDMPLSKVVDQIRGKQNTKVSLTVLDGAKGKQAVPQIITLQRDKVMIKDSEAKGSIHERKAPNGDVRKIGVVTIPSFYMDFEAARRGDADFKSTTRDVTRILEDFKKQNVEGVIVDLRTNGGGSLWEAIMLTGIFIKDGPVVQVRDKLETAVKYDDDGGLIVYDGPLVVMTNRLSASASEIFAAAIMDYGRGIIVGDKKSHGKGTVQSLSDLDRYMPFLSGEKYPAGSIKLTNAKFYRINGASTQLKGVTPDICFPSFTDSMELGEEKLDHALPWDTIAPVPYVKFDPSLAAKIPVLQEKSEKRVHANPDFKILKRDIAEFDKLRERKSVSLIFEKRWQEYLNEKAIQEEQDKLMRLDETAMRGSRKNNPSKKEPKDLYLEESINILSDFIDLGKN